LRSGNGAACESREAAPGGSSGVDLAAEELRGNWWRSMTLIIERRDDGD